MNNKNNKTFTISLLTAVLLIIAFLIASVGEKAPYKSLSKIIGADVQVEGEDDDSDEDSNDGEGIWPQDAGTDDDSSDDDSSNNQYKDLDPSLFGDVEEIERLEQMLMGKTWHYKSDDQKGYVFTDHMVREFWGGNSYDESWIDGKWRIVYMDEDFNIGSTANPETAGYRILVNSDRFNYNTYKIEFADEDSLTFTMDSYGDVYSEEFVAGDPLGTDLPEDGTYPELFAHIWQKTENGVMDRAEQNFMEYIHGTWIIMNADGTGEFRYGGTRSDYFAWCEKDGILYIGMRPNNGLENDIYMQVKYNVIRYEYSVIDDNNIKLTNLDYLEGSGSEEEFRITHE